MIDHILQVTLKHWDVNMRTLGAQSLRLVCQIDLPRLGYDAATQVVNNKESQSYSYRDLTGILVQDAAIS